MGFKLMDRRVRRTKEAIRSAYFSLLKEKKGERISVTEIAKKADIDRKTFYLHYEAPEDIMKEFGEEQIQLIVAALRSKGFFDAPLRLDLLFLSIQQQLESEKELFVMLASNPQLQFFWTGIQQIGEQALMNSYQDKVNVSHEELLFYTRFYITGLVYIYRDWLSGNKDLELEKVGEYVVKMAQNGILGIFN